jgi:antitoxin MazE
LGPPQGRHSSIRSSITESARSGNSLALTIDKPILEATGIDADTQLEISTDGDVIVISPVRSKKRTAKLEEILGKLDREYAGVFRRLAE